MGKILRFMQYTSSNTTPVYCLLLGSLFLEWANRMWGVRAKWSILQNGQSYRTLRSISQKFKLDVILHDVFPKSASVLHTRLRFLSQLALDLFYTLSHHFRNHLTATCYQAHSRNGRQERQSIFSRHHTRRRRV